MLNLKGEPEHVLKMYGLNKQDVAGIPVKVSISTEQEVKYFGRNCLMARRLLERGVRFVQIWSGADNGHPRRNWDSHEELILELEIQDSAILRDMDYPEDYYDEIRLMEGA